MSRSAGGWFWIGAGLGLVLASAAVVISTEFIHLRRQRLGEQGFLQDDGDLVEDLSHAVHEGLQVLSKAASEISHSFADARREMIRFGLDPTGSAEPGGGSSAWYTGDEE